jgi:hypothetical protein
MAARLVPDTVWRNIDRDLRMINRRMRAGTTAIEQADVENQCAIGATIIPTDERNRGLMGHDNRS